MLVTSITLPLQAASNGRNYMHYMANYMLSKMLMGDIISRGTNKSQLAFKGLWTGKTWSGDKGGGAHHCQRCHLWREEHAMARELRYVSHNNVMPM